MIEDRELAVAADARLSYSEKSRVSVELRPPVSTFVFHFEAFGFSIAEPPHVPPLVRARMRND